MFKLRRGDLGKAFLLIICIIGVIFYISWQMRRASAPKVVKQPTAPPAVAPAQTTNTNQMFAPRSRVTSNELVKARSVPDPFRPEVTDRSAPGASVPPSFPRTVARPETTFSPAGFWLTGIVRGRRPMAVIRNGEEHYFAFRGDIVSDGWKVAAISPDSALLTKGGEKITLLLSAAPPAVPSLQLPPNW